MPPIISIIGNSKSGKTTLIEKLVRELKSRGYKIATLKHAQDITFDDTDRDSWRHIQAGSEATAVVSPDKMVLTKPVASDITLDKIVSLFGEEYDIIITEGFKQGNAPKIEVHRRGTGPPLIGIKKLIAIATDEPLETRTRQFDLNDIKSIANLLEEGFILPQRERLSLYVNNTLITLGTFPREFITNVLMAMASSLKGVGRVNYLQVFLKKSD